MGLDGNFQSHFNTQDNLNCSDPHSSCRFAEFHKHQTDQLLRPHYPSILHHNTHHKVAPTAWEIVSPHHHAGSSALGEQCSLPALPASSENEKNSLDAKSLHVTTRWTDRDHLLTRHSSPTQTERAAADQRQVWGPQVYVSADVAPLL